MSFLNRFKKNDEDNFNGEDYEYMDYDYMEDNDFNQYSNINNDYYNKVGQEYLNKKNQNNNVNKVSKNPNKNYNFQNNISQNTMSNRSEIEYNLYGNQPNREEEKVTNKILKRHRKKNKKKDIEDYSYSTGYEDEMIYYDENGEQIFYRRSGQTFNIILATMGVFYLLFLGIGFSQTTFSQGYMANVVTVDTIGQREVYKDVLEKIQYIEELEGFEGIPELKEIHSTKSFSERVPPLRSSLNKINKEVEDLKNAQYKIKDNNYINVEMMNMVKDLLNAKGQTIQLAIQYYETVNGYTSTTEVITNIQNELLNSYQIYLNKLSTYKLRLEEIKVNELKLNK